MADKLIVGADPQTIRKLLVSHFYEVPDFQREYVWKAKQQVRKLLTDLQSAYDARAEEGDYFLGSIVFWEEGAVRWLVDGQQRMTTLYILVAAMRDHAKATSNEASVGKYEIALRGVNAESDSDTPTHRVKLQSELTSTILGDIADEKGGALNPGRGGSRYRIVKAYQECRDFLAKDVGDETEVAKFFDYVWKQTYLIEIETLDLQSAYRIFQTLNDRGATLLASDLLKSLLFRIAASDKAAQASVKESWGATLDALDEANEINHVRFLRYFFMAEYASDSVLRAESLFEWLTQKDKNVDLQKDLKDPAKFARKVRDAAQAYAAFSLGRTSDGKTDVMSLHGIRHQGTGVKQHLCVLLAGRKLKKSAFTELADALETLTLAFALAKRRWNVLEGKLPTWTQQVREVAKSTDQDVSIRDFVEAEFVPLLDELAVDLWQRLDDTEPDPRKLVECMLARMAFYVQKQAILPGDWDTLVADEMTLEHILPQGLKKENLEEFGVVTQEEGRAYAFRLGNLALMPWGKNSAMSDRLWASVPPGAPKSHQPKKVAFANSDWLLFNSLGDNKKYGYKGASNTTIDEFGLEEAPAWNVAAFMKRQASLERIAAKVWPLLPPRPKLTEVSSSGGSSSVAPG